MPSDLTSLWDSYPSWAGLGLLPPRPGTETRLGEVPREAGLCVSTDITLSLYFRTV